MRTSFYSRITRKVNFFKALLWILFLTSSVDAQHQESTDQTLSTFVGKWQGTYIQTGRDFLCEVEFTWILQNRYMEGHLLLSDKQKPMQVEQEILVILSSAGQGRIVRNAFDSRGISSWGVMEADNNSFLCSFEYSTGLKESGVLQRRTQEEMQYNASVHDAQDELIDQITMRLHRVKERR